MGQTVWTVWFWDRTICGWDRLYITTQATKVLPWAHKTARLGTQLSNIHASPDAFTNYLTHLSSPIFPESESMCAETSLACAHRRIHFKVTEVSDWGASWWQWQAFLTQNGAEGCGQELSGLWSSLCIWSCLRGEMKCWTVCMVVVCGWCLMWFSWPPY